MNQNDLNHSKMMLVASMFIFGTIGIFRRYIPMASATLAMTRGLVGMMFLLVVIKISKKKLNMTAIKNNLLLLVVSGAFIGINWVLLFEAYNHTTVAIATLCYYMAPIIVILLSPIVLKESLSGRKLICVVVALFGMVLVSGVFAGDAGEGDFSGVIFGLGAAAFYASVILLNQKIKDIGAYDKTIMQLGVAGAAIIPYVILTDNTNWASMTIVSFIMVAVVCFVHTGLAYTLYFGSMDKVPAQTVALFSYIDPIVAILLSAFLLHESMGLLEIIGTVCVLGATIISEFISNN